MTCIPAFGYYQEGNILRACVSADGGISWNVAGLSSAGITSTSNTMSGILLSEGFEHGSMPPLGWTEDADGSAKWAKTDYAHSGNYGAEFNHDDTGDGSSLITPAINCSNYEDLSLEFWHMQLGDGLTVSISDDGGNSWDPLGSYNEDIMEYAYETVDISDWDGSSQLKLKFRAAGSEGFSCVRIDDILISGESSDLYFQGFAVRPINGAELSIDTKMTVSELNSAGTGGVEVNIAGYNAYSCVIDDAIQDSGSFISCKFTYSNGWMEISLGNPPGALASNLGIHPVSFNGTASGCASVIAINLADNPEEDDEIVYRGTFEGDSLGFFEYIAVSYTHLRAHET